MILANCFSLGLLFLGVIHQEIMLLYIGSFMFGSIYSVGAVGIPMLTHISLEMKIMQELILLLVFLQM